MPINTLTLSPADGATWIILIRTASQPLAGVLSMKQSDIPHTPFKGTIARLAIQCDCPDTGATGSFLFVGESHRNKKSRVTPVYDDLYELCQAIGKDWEEVRGSVADCAFIKR